MCWTKALGSRPPFTFVLLPGIATVSLGPFGEPTATLISSPGRAAVVYDMRHVRFSSWPIAP